MSKLEVLKFGGSSLGEPAEIENGFKKILPIIKEKVDGGVKIIIVISAFMGRTRELRNESLNLGNRSNSPEEDAMLCKGEEESSQFLFKRLRRRGYKTGLFGVKDIPLITDSSHGEAEILDVNTKDIKAKLAINDIVVIPGFIGRTAFNQTTTLGFDGSDTSAVYLARAMGCKCTLFKDVKGICTADPRYVEKSSLLPKINTEDALMLALLGSRVIHYKALAAAKEIKLIVRPNFTEGEGTLISMDVPRAKVAGVTYKRTNRGVVVSAVGNIVCNGMMHSCLDEYKTEEFQTAYAGVDSVLLKDEEKLPEVLKFAHTVYALDSKSLQSNVSGKGKAAANKERR